MILTHFTIFFALFALLLNQAKASSDVGIFYKENHTPIAGGPKEIRIMTFVGIQNEYSIESNRFAQKAYSIATCDLKLNETTGQRYHSSPCSTSVLRNLQSFTIYCSADEKNSFAIVNFYPIDQGIEGKSDQGWTASIFTHGKINAGFSTDPQGLQLRQNPDPTTPLFTKAADPSAIFNGNGKNREVVRVHH